MKTTIHYKYIACFRLNNPSHFLEENAKYIKGAKNKHYVHFHSFTIDHYSHLVYWFGYDSMLVLKVLTVNEIPVS